MTIAQQIAEKLPDYTNLLQETYAVGGINHDLLEGIAYALWRANFDNDASKVACSQSAELAYVRDTFVKKRLELDHMPDEAIDKVIHEVCQEMGQSNRNKQRVVFYYLLTQKLGREEVFTFL